MNLDKDVENTGSQKPHQQDMVAQACNPGTQEAKRKLTTHARLAWARVNPRLQTRQNKTKHTISDSPLTSGARFFPETDFVLCVMFYKKIRRERIGLVDVQSGVGAHASPTPSP